jgi:1-acyl-sn-glycerol-3-phosphate acyltransferase
VDAYGASVKAALADGRQLASAVVLARPGQGRPVPPVPSVDPAPAAAPVDEAPRQTAEDVTS